MPDLTVFDFCIQAELNKALPLVTMKVGVMRSIIIVIVMVAATNFSVDV